MAVDRNSGGPLDPGATFGRYTRHDGLSRPLNLDGDLRTVIASTLAVRDGWAEIRPAHWRTAGAVAKALAAAGWTRRGREPRTGRATQQASGDADV